MNFSLSFFFMALKHNVIYFCRVFCTCKRLPQCGAQLPNCVHTHTHKYIPGILSLIIEFIELHARLTCKRERKNDVNDDCLNHGGLESASNYVYTCRNHGEQGSGAAWAERGRGRCSSIAKCRSMCRNFTVICLVIASSNTCNTFASLNPSTSHSPISHLFPCLPSLSLPLSH